MLTLDQLSPGQRRAISNLTADRTLRVRLMEQGFIKGREVALVRGGTALICELDGCRLSLSKSLASHIQLSA